MKMSKNRLNFWIDILMFIDMLIISLIGLLIKYVLPPGTGGRHGGWGEGKALTFIGMSRHEWGDVHFILAIVLLALLVIHIILHWNWIVYQIKCTFKKKDKQESCDADLEE